MVCSSVYKSPLWKCERGFLPTVQLQTNRGSSIRKMPFQKLKSITLTWRLGGFFFFGGGGAFCALIELWEMLALQNSYQQQKVEGRRTCELFLGRKRNWSNDKPAVFPQLHIGRRQRRMRKQQWLNLNCPHSNWSSYKLPTGFRQKPSDGKLWWCVIIILWSVFTKVKRGVFPSLTRKDQDPPDLASCCFWTSRTF